MKTYKKLLFLFCTIVFITSCDYFLSADGKVIDSQTLLPVRNANVSVIVDDKYTMDNLAYIYDTIDFAIRDSINRINNLEKEWKNEGWFVSVMSIGTGVYTKPGPLYTDSLGFFDIFQHMGKFSTFQVRIEKDGYKTKLINDDYFRFDSKRTEFDTIFIKFEKNNSNKQ